MREIKFRGKRIDNGEWVEGALIDWAQFNNHGATIIVPPLHFAVDPATVGQFTGLLDKNGVRIFEGDKILFDGYTKYEVRWAEDCGAWSYGEDVVTYKDQCHMVEIIGNIHDNQEEGE